jgi:hypothetical protein
VDGLFQRTGQRSPDNISHLSSGKWLQPASSCLLLTLDFGQKTPILRARIQWPSRSVKYILNVMKEWLSVFQPVGYREDRTRLWCDMPKPVLGQDSQIAKVYTSILVDTRRRVLPQVWIRLIVSP